MRFRNLIAIATGSVLVAALGISAHAQLSNGLGTVTRTGLHNSLSTERTERSEVASEARDAEPEQEPEQEQPKAEPTEKPEAPETETDNDNQNEQGENDNSQHDSGGGGD